MPTARLRTGSTSDAMKSAEGNDSLDTDTFIRQAVGKEPYLSLPRTNDNPVQWIQLLQALDHQDFPGWPLLTPLKVQMQKCEKCSREFCSPINYRRHIRVHRRSLNVDKESHKNRDLLGAFWDKLSFNEAKEIVSFDDVILEEVPGSSIIKALASFIYKPGFCALPQVYVKAGSLLLDVIQARPSRLPLSSQELFSILDNASERTFLCASTAESMQKYVFDRDAVKVALEMKNLVACTSFLIEQKLIKAWLADKDAEALRCQKLLVEEEEASMRRQAELLKKKKQKKVRQKEQKAKEQLCEEEPEISMVDILESLPLAESSSHKPLVESHASDDVSSLPEPVPNNKKPGDVEARGDCCNEHINSGLVQNADHRKNKVNVRQRLVASRRQLPKAQKVGRNDCHPNHNFNVANPDLMQKNSSHRDARAAPVNGSKIWTRKAKAENGGECVTTRVREEDVNQIEQTDCAVMIGSISVTVRNCSAQEEATCQSETQNSCNTKHVMPKKAVAQDKLMKPDIVHSSTSRSTGKCWMPVSRHDSPSAVRRGNRESEKDPISGVSGDCTMPGESCPSLYKTENNQGKSSDIMETNGLPFSIHSARDFLAQRWKETISEDHITLILYPESDCEVYHNGRSDYGISVTASKASVVKERSIHDTADNKTANSSSSKRRAKAKTRTKPEKGVQIKYIPKKKTVA